MKEPKLTKAAEIKQLKAHLAAEIESKAHLLTRVYAYEQAIKNVKEETELQREFIRVKTELISAMGWAMKACSSIAWSDKPAAFGKPRM